jgi:hypothetical protein
MTTGLRLRIDPIDDWQFTQAVEHAREQVLTEGLVINGSKAAGRAQQLLRAAGYPAATVECEQTAEEAMQHAATWIVRRSGHGGR